MGSFWPKYIMFQLKKYRGVMFDGTQDSYKVWRKTELCFQKLTWRIWHIFTRTLERLQIGTMMASFCLKLKIYELKIYRRVMCHDNEEWCKNWRGIDLSVQNLRGIWRILTRALKNLKNLHLNGLLLTKVYNVWAKKSRGIMFDSTEYWCKTWRKTYLCFQKWHEEFSKFSLEHVRKCKNWDFDGILLSKEENVWA